MRIKKVSKTTQTGAQIIDGYSNSQVSGYSCNYLNKMDRYSTSETRTNKVWIDGKPIYRKVVTGNMSDGSIAHGLTDVTFVNAYGFFIASSGSVMPLPSLRVNYASYSAGFYINSTQVAFDKGTSAAGTVYVTLEYTKTTDAPVI